jgi:flagellar hook-associated protein 2
MDLKLAGLASNFDWKSLVDQLMELERVPITRLNKEKLNNISKNTSLTDLETKLNALKTSSTALGAAGLFSGRNVASTTSGSTWSSIAATGTDTGSYAIAVSRLATAAKREGTADIGQPLHTADDVSGLTLASLPTATAVTAGTFSVNGKKVTVALTDSLASVFTAISTATSGAVTASYDHTTDKITLNGSGSEVFLGAANDTSNFLATMKLANRGDNNPVVSSSGLGTLNKNVALTSARLTTAVGNADGSGNSSFTINGESIAYNINDDTLTEVMQRINQSDAGVTAAYDAATDRVTLTNKTTGDTNITLSETGSGLLTSLGLLGSTLTRGQNAQYTVNGGSTLTSTSNTFGAESHGIEGLSVSVDSETTQTITVSSDTASMRTAVDNFIAKFNDVQTFLEEKTKVTSKDGKVTAALLSDNREIQSWARSLRQKAFNAVSGLGGTISRLENLGIDFTSGTNLLEVKSSTKLDTALRDVPEDVEEFFQTASTGLAAQLSSYADSIIELNDDQQERLVSTNTSLDKQMEDFQRRLDQRKALLESSFIAMESAQAKIQNQSSQLTRAFSTSSSS